MITIEATILKDGRTILHVEGVKGVACMELTELLASQLGEVERVDPTEEFYEQERASAKEKERA